MQRVLVVPWSSATTYLDITVFPFLVCVNSRFTLALQPVEAPLDFSSETFTEKIPVASSFK
jgi:hypothetical protein